MSRLSQVLVAFDQLLNACAGGYADETMSSRCWRCRDEQPYTFLRKTIDILFWFDKNHCQEAYNSERQRKYLPREFQRKKRTALPDNPL